MKESKHLSDIEFIKDWTITILQYMSDQYSPHAQYAGVNYKLFFQRKIDRILENFKRNNKRGMTMVYNDINRLATYEALNKEGLNKLLFEKFGWTLADDEKDVQKRITKIIKQNKIINEDEYLLVKEYINKICADKNKNQLGEKLDTLIFEFEDLKK